MPLIPPEKLQELKEKNPTLQLHLLTTESGEEAVVVKAPDRGSFKRFRAQMQDDKKRLDAAEVLVRACLLYPDSAAFDVMLDRKPALIETFGNAILDIAGLEKSPEKKAL